MRRGPLFVLALLAIPASAAAQVATRQHTLFYYTNAAFAVHDACRGPACATFASATTQARVVYRFVESPLTVAPPTLPEIDAALAAMPIDSSRSENTGTIGTTASTTGASTAFSSTVVAALGRVFLDRARAELIESVFRDLDRALHDTNHPDLGKLLPQTAAAVGQMENTNLQSMLPILRAAMDDDLRHLPLRLADSTLSLWKDGNGQTHLPAAAPAVAAVARVGLTILSGAPPILQLATLDQIDSAAIRNADLRRTLYLLGTVARDFAQLDASTAYSPPWFERSASVVNTLLLNTQALRVYAVLTMNAVNMPVNTPQVAVMADLVALGGRFAMASGSIDHPPSPVDLLEISSDFVATAMRLLPPDQQTVLSPVGIILDGLRSAVAERSYGRLIQATSALLSSASTDAADRLSRLVTLAGALAAAKTQDDAVSALEAWADPVGSFRDRRLANHWRVTIVGYLGAAAGTEHVQAAPGSAGGNITGRHAGLFAPLGVELSSGVKLPIIGNASLGVLGSVLNLGAVVDYQYHNGAAPGTDVEPLPETITLRNVVAPGLFATLGLTRNYPLTIGFGVQRAPRLRHVSDANGVRNQDAIQYSGFVAVDLSLFRLARWGAR